MRMKSIPKRVELHNGYVEQPQSATEDEPTSLLIDNVETSSIATPDFTESKIKRGRGRPRNSVKTGRVVKCVTKPKLPKKLKTRTGVVLSNKGRNGVDLIGRKLKRKGESKIVHKHSEPEPKQITVLSDTSPFANNESRFPNSTLDQVDGTQPEDTLKQITNLVDVKSPSSTLPRLWFNGYKFRKIRQKQDITTWRCVYCFCIARIKTTSSGEIVYTNNQPHVHKVPRRTVDTKTNTPLFTVSTRAVNSKAWFDGFRFSLVSHSQDDGLSFWRCTAQCSASIKTDKGDTVVFIGPQPHSHPPPDPERFKDTHLVLQRGSVTNAILEDIETTVFTRAAYSKAWFDGFRFTLIGQNRLDGVSKWRCAAPLCSASLKTDKSDAVVLIGPQPHSHPPPNTEHFKDTVILLHRGSDLSTFNRNAENRTGTEINDLLSAAVAMTTCKIEPVEETEEPVNQGPAGIYLDTEEELKSSAIAVKRQKLTHSALTRALSQRLNQFATLESKETAVSYSGERSFMKQATRISTAAIRKALKSSHHHNGGKHLSAVGDTKTTSAESNSPPRRLRYFRSRTTLPFDVADDSSSDVDSDNDDDSERRWMLEDAGRMLAEFVDVNPGERRLMTLWNEFMFERVRHRADRGMVLLCCEFVAVFGKKIVEENLTRNFFCHLAGLNSHRILTASQVYEIYEKILELSVHDIVR